MTVRKLAAIALIFVGVSVAWNVLGLSLTTRSGALDDRLEKEVQLLWGTPQRQVAPTAWVARPVIVTETVQTKDATGKLVPAQVSKGDWQSIPAALETTRATVDLDLEHRQRGLLWYPTYSVAFNGTYTFRNPDREEREIFVRLLLPAEHALYDDFVFTVDGRPSTFAQGATKDITGSARVAPGATAEVRARYRSRGLRTWTYAFAETGVAQVRDFRMAMHTNFRDVDFPPGSVSPVEKAASPSGWTLDWNFTNLISGQALGMEMPQKLNPGPFAARVTFFAPVSLLFFLAVMVITTTVSGPSLHPMHYWFIAAAFFAFHLLLAYLVDHIGIHLAFGVSAAVSLALVGSYLRVAAGMGGALRTAVLSQATFLVLFSYAFFFEGFTGLTITVGAIVTLFVLMQMTAHVSWDEVFRTGGPDRLPQTMRKEVLHAERA